MSTRMRVFVALGAVSAFCGAGAARAANIPAFTFTGFASDNTSNTTHYSLGYTFTTTQPLTITALGVLDIGGTSVANGTPSGGTKGSGFPVKLYYSASPPATTGTVDGGQTSGTLVTGGSALVTSTDPILSLSGGTYTSGDGFRYHTLTTPITLAAGTYEIANSQLGTGFGSNATGIAEATGVSAPTHATFTNPDDTGSYNPNTFDNNLPGNIGPNFLDLHPGARAVGLLAAGLLALRRCAGRSVGSQPCGRR